MTKSEAINEALRLALKFGNEVKEESHSWSQMATVVLMRFPAKAELKKILVGDSRLRYVESTYDCHYGEYSFTASFLDDVNGVCISFPREKL